MQRFKEHNPTAQPFDWIPSRCPRHAGPLEVHRRRPIRGLAGALARKEGHVVQVHELRTTEQAAVDELVEDEHENG